MSNLKSFGLKLLSFLPFGVLAVALVIAIHHIMTYH